jgi:hypothetical protein
VVKTSPGTAQTASEQIVRPDAAQAALGQTSPGAARADVEQIQYVLFKHN